MKRASYLSFILVILSKLVFSQSIDEPFSQKKMRKDLEVFKNTRIAANSGLYKYRTKEQIDSIYAWAEHEIGQSYTYREFYNIICQLTDFEGSSHNNTDFSKKHLNNLEEETSGYFPYPIKWINGKWLLNFNGGTIPLGSEIVEINNIPMAEIISNLYKYYTTDGQNLTGKRVGIRGAFPRYFRLNYGLVEQFKVTYRVPGSDTVDSNNLESIGYSDYKKNINKMYSLPMDKFYYAESKDGQKYHYEQIDASTALLTIYTWYGK